MSRSDNRYALPAALLLFLGTGAGGTDFFLDVGASGGYESNLNNAVESAERQGGLIGAAWASVEAVFESSKRLALVLDGGWTGNVFPTHADLSSHSLIGGAMLIVKPSSATAFRLAAHGGARMLGDDSQDSLLTGGALGVRLRPGSRWSILGTLRVDARFARDPELTGVRGSAGAFLELDLYPGGWLSAGYTYEDGPPTLFRTSGGSDGAGRWVDPPSLGHGSLQSSSLAVHVLSAEARLGIAKGLYLHAGYDFSWMLPTDSPAYPVHAVSGGLGFEL